jgi:hypothetical protein
VDPLELIAGIGLAGLIVAIAVYFAVQQRKTMAMLRHDTTMSLDDRRFWHRQVVRRMAGSVLLFLFAAMLVGWLFLAPSLEAMRPPEPREDMPESAKETLRLLTGYVIAAMLVFGLALLIAVLDALATLRYGARHRRLLENDRRAALAEEVERLQRDRHGLNGSRH